MNYFSEFFGNLIGFAVLLFLTFILIDGICGIRDFFKYRGGWTLKGSRRTRKFL